MATYRNSKPTTADDGGLRDDTMCRANGCPNRWTVAGSGRLCSTHAWAPAHEWPRLTQWLIDGGKAQQANPKTAGRPLTAKERQALVARVKTGLAAIGGPKDTTAWARELQAREQQGERLHEFHKQLWRRVLRCESGGEAN